MHTRGKAHLSAPSIFRKTGAFAKCAIPFSGRLRAGGCSLSMETTNCRIGFRRSHGLCQSTFMTLSSSATLGTNTGSPNPFPAGKIASWNFPKRYWKPIASPARPAPLASCQTTLLQQVRHTSVWAKAYRRDFLLEQQLWFPERQQKSQDVLFNTLVYHACRSAAYIPTVMYYYRTHPRSICNRYHPDFLPGMELLMQRNLAHIDALFPGRADVLDAFYRYRVIGILLDAMRLHVFHPDNPLPLRQRRAAFQALLKQPLFAYSLAHLNLDDYWLERQFLLNCARKRRFALLNFAYRHPWVLRVYGGVMHRKNLLKDRFSWRRFQRNR